MSFSHRAAVGISSPTFASFVFFLLFTISTSLLQYSSSPSLSYIFIKLINSLSFSLLPPSLPHSLPVSLPLSLSPCLLPSLSLSLIPQSLFLPFHFSLSVSQALRPSLLLSFPSSSFIPSFLLSLPSSFSHSLLSSFSLLSSAFLLFPSGLFLPFPVSLSALQALRPAPAPHNLRRPSRGVGVSWRP